MKFPVPQGKPFIQPVHVQDNHWITVSNIDVKQKSHYRDGVCVYDSGLGPHISKSTKEIICQFVKPTSEYLIFDTINIQSQPNLSDCGLYAIACATE